MNEPTRDTLIAYLHGERCDAESSELTARLGREPDLAERLMEVAREEATLRCWALDRTAGRELDEALAGTPPVEGAPSSHSRPRRKRRLFGAAIVAAAGLLFVAALVVLRSGPDPAAPVAAVEDFRGSVRVLRDGMAIVVAAAGQELRVHDRLTTADEPSAVTVILDDGTRLALAGDTAVVFEQEQPGQWRLVVDQGSIAASVRPQPATRPLLLTTANARLEVLGTSFLVDARQDSTRLSVAEGRVRFTRLSDGASVEVTGGQHALAATDEPLAASELAGPSDAWEADFEAGLPAAWNRGALTRDDLPAGSRGAVRTLEIRQADGFYYHIGTPKAWNEGLFALHADTHLHFTYRLTRPDWFQVFLSTRSRDADRPATATYRFKHERLWWPMTPGQWRTATVPLTAFGRVSDWSEEPPGADELPFEILFSSKDNNLSLVIDRIWVTRGGPGEFQNSEVE
jgi:ferric-dicitrate binding protein FerR (iron transport regulator)